jgi:hypothetical protein
MISTMPHPLPRRNLFVLCGGLAVLLGTPLPPAGSQARVDQRTLAQPPRTVALYFDREVAPLHFAADRLEQALGARGYEAVRRPLAELDRARDHAAIVLARQDDRSALEHLPERSSAHDALGAEGFVVVRDEERGRSRLWVVGADANGTMYGGLEVAEQVRIQGNLASVPERRVEPRFPFRAIKFNLPWMSYRQHDALQLHEDTVRDLAFWEDFLDMMAANRFNVLSLWSMHPFHYMVTPEDFPEATPFSREEMAEWQAFWRALFAMAKQRGIETYIVNWNIFVSPEFARAHDVATYSIDWEFTGEGDMSELIKAYTRQVVRQVIDEYEDLTGLGVTLAERMGGTTAEERNDWLQETFGRAMAEARRPIKFIHRAPLSADRGMGGSQDDNVALLTRRGIDQLRTIRPVWLEMKFNWSHAYSSPRLIGIHGGEASEHYWSPAPAGYRIAWTMRNEDFFVLRWAEPDFIRRHIELNGHDYVGGYFIGSETYIPAKDFLTRADDRRNWTWAFERQWLLYMMWGRLLYDDRTPDAIFVAELERRYGEGLGRDLLEGWKRASRMPLRLASFYRATWDFTLYSEGFWALPGFISLPRMIDRGTLDPAYVSIRDYMRAVEAGEPFEEDRKTPPRLAEVLERDATEALHLVASLQARIQDPGPIDYELADIQAWSHLSLYFAHKLRSAVALETYRRTGEAAAHASALTHIEHAADQWDAVIEVTRPLYPDVPLLHWSESDRAGELFSWEQLRPEVQQDVEYVRNAK